VIGLLVTSDGIPIAHHVFSGNTADRSTLPQVMADLQGSRLIPGVNEQRA
jgi:transposase